MPYDPVLHHRRSIRLRGYDYSQAAAYFVTVCAQDHRCLFGDIVKGEMMPNECGRVAAEGWGWLPRQYGWVELDAWTVMPNHLHGIVIIHENDLVSMGRGGSRTAPTASGGDVAVPSVRKPLGRLIGAFKTVSTKRINELRGTPGAPVWQRNYYDHVIRGERSLQEIREYIAGNPLRWELDELHPHHIRT